jgi:hypothetical protein
VLGIFVLEDYDNISVWQYLLSFFHQSLQSEDVDIHHERDSEVILHNLLLFPEEYVWMQVHLL